MSDVLELIQDVSYSNQLELNANVPGSLKFMNRNGNGKAMPYDDDKIKVAIAKAFIAVEGGTAATSWLRFIAVKAFTKIKTAKAIMVKSIQV